jgi:uncharacterized membrane protein
MDSGSSMGSPESFTGVRPANDTDKLVSALGYVFWFIVPIIVLVTEMKESTFNRIHAFQGLVFGGAGFLFFILYTCVTTAISAVVPPLACVLWIGYLLPLALGLYVAYKTYSTGQVEFVYLSQLTRALFRQQLARAT